MEIERITKNEQRLDDINQSILKMEEALNDFKENTKNVKLLNKYYGSKNWFKDKDDYENNKIPHIKAGVLSEDAVWNMNEELNELIKEMKKIIKSYNKKD